jgi:hypothetical protein
MSSTLLAGGLTLSISQVSLPKKPLCRISLQNATAIAFYGTRSARRPSVTFPEPCCRGNWVMLRYPRIAIRSSGTWDSLRKEIRSRSSRFTAGISMSWNPCRSWIPMKAPSFRDLGRPTLTFVTWLSVLLRGPGAEAFRGACRFTGAGPDCD